MANVSIKRGDTFAYSFELTDNGTPLTGIAGQLKSQVRTNGGDLLSELAIAETATPGTYVATAASTAEWPVKTVYFDIQRTDSNGVVTSTDTVGIDVIKDVTF